jgi:hypothetical protein
MWEGLSGGLFYNAEIPESNDAFNVTIRFFDCHLDGSPK